MNFTNNIFYRRQVHQSMLLVPVLLSMSVAALAQTTTTTPPAPTPGSFFPFGSSTATTVTSNGDTNPYGVVIVPPGFPTTGTIQTGDILVSNFNNAAGLQGLGSSIARITSRGVTSTFFQGQFNGLTAALGILQSGYIFVGNLPSTDGTPNTISPGSILLLNSSGKQIGGLSGTAFVNGPWGMAIADNGNGIASMFVSNVLDGSVVRFDLTYIGGLKVYNQVKIAAGMNNRTDPAAFVLGPSGLAFDAVHDILYVASSADNAVYSIPNALTIEQGNPVTPTLVYSDMVHLHGPLNLNILPNGNLITANSDGSNVDPNQPSEIVEFTTAGKFVSQMSIDPENGGAFGMALQTLGSSGLLRFAAVDDVTNSLTMWTTSPTN